jgi:signal transduction histidine kinase/HPt (histidine-containing phosphotransfer) domain-containing protein
MKKNKVLIIDDQPVNIKSFRHILGDEYVVFAADNGKSGLKCAREQLPDVILLDILMPEMDGYDVIKVLKAAEETRHIPVIFATSLDSKEDEEKGLALGAADYISKPFHTATLKLRVMNQIKILNLQREAEESARIAVSASDAKSAFLANMSHEIRTPMNVIMGLTEMLLEENLTVPGSKDSLNKINTAGEILLELINGLLDISKIEAGKLTLTPTRYSVAKLLGDIISLNIIRIADKPIVFKLNIESELYCNLYGDDLRLKQILNNLLSNSFKYTREGTVTLAVNCVRENENVRLTISVSDTGIGIRQEDIEKLFKDYNQVDVKANRLIEGTGLGLSITKGLTELMNGDVSVESEYGKGSTFRVSLAQGFVSDEIIDAETIKNLCDLRYESEFKPAQIQDRRDFSHARVLVVDDYAPNLDVAKWMLGKYKMQVDCASSGQEAIDLIIKQGNLPAGAPRYNAVFMDHMMPGMDGIEALQVIRGLDSDYAKNIPVIALTANAVAGNEKMFLASGFQAFLPKPIERTRLDEIVRGILSETPVINIPGINTERGMFLFEGDTAMFIDFLRSYVTHIPAELDKLRIVSDLKSYATDVHTIKGASAGIGADDLAELAKRLEIAAKAGDLQAVSAENESFCRAVEALTADIKAFINTL